jgi:PAS domain S-box-containing protein
MFVKNIINYILRTCYIHTKMEQDTRQRFEKMLSAVPGMVYEFVMDKDGNFSLPYASSVSEEIYGVSAREAMEDCSNIFGKVHPDDLNSLHKSIQKSSESLKCWEWTGRHVIDGVIKTLKGCSNPTRHPDGSTLWTGYIRDISQLVQMENRHSRMLNLVPGMVYEFLRDASGENISFPYASSKATEIYGISAESLMENCYQIFEMVHPEDLEQLNESIKISAMSLSRWDHTWRIIVNGKTKTLLGCADPVKREDGSILWTGVVRDISQQVELEKRHERLLSKIPGMVYEFKKDTNGKFSLPFSSTNGEIFGVPVSELKEDFTKLFSLVHPEDLPLCMAALSESEKNLTKFEWTGRIVMPDTTVKVMRSCGNPVKNPDGSIMWTGYKYDITDQVEVEQRLQAEINSTSRYERLLSKVPGMVYEFKRDANGEYSVPYASSVARDLYCVPACEIMEDCKKAFGKIHPDDLPSCMETINRSADEMTPWIWTGRIIMDDKSVKVVRGCSNPMKEEDGSILWSGYKCDVTKETDVRERLESVMDSTHDLITQIKISNGKAYRIYNSKAHANYGIAIGDLDDDVPLVSTKVFNTDDLDKLNDIIIKFDRGDIKSGYTWEMDKFNMPFEHKLTWCNIERRTATLVSRNISDRVAKEKLAIENAILETEKRKDAEALHFLAHQIKNRFLALEGLNENMRINIREHAKHLLQLPHNVRDTLRDIDGQVKRGIQICMHEQVTRQIIYDNYVSCRSVVAIRDMLKKFCGTRLDFRIDKDVPSHINVDINLLTHVLENHVSNATKYGGSDFEEYIWVHVESPNVVFSTVNSPGRSHQNLLAQQKKNRSVFDSLHDAGTRGTYQAQGVSNGNGLFIAKKCAFALGGDIDLMFEKDRVLANLMLNVECCSNQSLINNTKLPKNTVLYAVEDDEFIRDIFERVFKEIQADENSTIFGATAESIVDFPKMVLALPKNKRPALIMLDENLEHPKTGLPLTFGTTLLKELRGKSYAGKIIIRSANNSSSDIERYRKAGADGIIPKSVRTPEDLVRYVTNILKGSSTDYVFRQKKHKNNNLAVLDRFRTSTRDTCLEILRSYSKHLSDGKTRQAIWSKIHRIKGRACILGLRNMQSICERLRALLGESISPDKLMQDKITENIKGIITLCHSQEPTKNKKERIRVNVREAAVKLQCPNSPTFGVDKVSNQFKNMFAEDKVATYVKELQEKRDSLCTKLKECWRLRPAKQSVIPEHIHSAAHKLGGRAAILGCTEIDAICKQIHTKDILLSDARVELLKVKFV